MHTSGKLCLHFVQARLGPGRTYGRPPLLCVPAGVDVAFANGAPEEALAAVAAGGSVVFPCGLVPADGTVGGDPVWPVQAGLRRHAVCSAQRPIKVNKRGTITTVESVSCAPIMGHTADALLNHTGNGLISAKQQRFMTVAQHSPHSDSTSLFWFL